MVKANLTSLLESMRVALASELGMFKPSKEVFDVIIEDLEALDSIYQCGLTQERISNDVLSLGKIQLDKLQMFDVETDIGAFALKTTGVFQNEAKMSDIQIELEVSPAFKRLGLQTIMTDPVRLSQIVTNLLSNAIRFTSNSPIRQIKLHFDIGLTPPAEGTCVKPADDGPSSDDSVYLFVSVSDTGPGLTSTELTVLFQRFSQASPETHTVFGGSGLGLFVCRKIAQRMGGRIDVVSRHGHGSEFQFFIQARKCVAPSPKLVANKVNVMAQAGNGGGDQLAAVRRVLIVEDNPINRTVLLRQLRGAGLEAQSANDGLEALELIRATMGMGGAEVTTADGDAQPSTPAPFDCVLMDLEMPIMDGYTAARHLRDGERAGSLRRSNIVALTGNARQATIDTKMVDFDDVVVKPYRINVLLKRMDELVRAARGRDGEA